MTGARVVPALDQLALLPTPLNAGELTTVGALRHLDKVNESSTKVCRGQSREILSCWILQGGDSVGMPENRVFDQLPDHSAISESLFTRNIQFARLERSLGRGIPLVVLSFKFNFSDLEHLQK